MYETGVIQAARSNGNDHPVRGEVRDAPTLATAAVDPRVVDRSRDRVDDEPEDERPDDDDGKLDGEPEDGDDSEDDG